MSAPPRYFVLAFAAVCVVDDRDARIVHRVELTDVEQAEVDERLAGAVARAREKADALNAQEGV